MLSSCVVSDAVSLSFAAVLILEEEEEEEDVESRGPARCIVRAVHILLGAQLKQAKIQMITRVMTGLLCGMGDWMWRAKCRRGKLGKGGRWFLVHCITLE